MTAKKQVNFALTPPEQLWRRILENRYTMADCVKALKSHRIRVTRPTLHNWFVGRTSPPLDKWARVEPVLRKMVEK